MRSYSPTGSHRRSPCDPITPSDRAWPTWGRFGCCLLGACVGRCSAAILFGHPKPHLLRQLRELPFGEQPARARNVFFQTFSLDLPTLSVALSSSSLC